MASEHPGFIPLRVTLRVAWWVAPYSYTVKAFLCTVAPFLADDDDRLDAFIIRQAEFIARHGFRVVAE